MILLRLSLFVGLAITQACAHEIPNVPIYQDLGASGYELYTLPGMPEREVHGQEWQDIKDGSFIVPYESWSKIKLFILKVCKDYGKCTEEEAPLIEEHLKQIDVRLQRLL